MDPNIPRSGSSSSLDGSPAGRPRAGSEYGFIDGQVKDLSAQLLAARRDVQRCLAECEEERNRGRRQSESIVSLTAEKIDTERQLTAVYKEKEELKTIKQEMQDQIIGLRGDRDELDDACGELRASVQQLVEQNNDLKGRLASSVKQYEELRDSADELTNENSEVKERLIAATAQLERVQAELSDLRGSSDAKKYDEETLHGYATTVQNLQHTLTQKDKSLAEWATVNESLRETVAIREAQCSEQKRTIDDLETRLLVTEEKLISSVRQPASPSTPLTPERNSPLPHGLRTPTSSIGEETETAKLQEILRSVVLLLVDKTTVVTACKEKVDVLLSQNRRLLKERSAVEQLLKEEEVRIPNRLRLPTLPNITPRSSPRGNSPRDRVSEDGESLGSPPSAPTTTGRLRIVVIQGEGLASLHTVIPSLEDDLPALAYVRVKVEGMRAEATDPLPLPLPRPTAPVFTNYDSSPPGVQQTSPVVTIPKFLMTMEGAEGWDAPSPEDATHLDAGPRWNQMFDLPVATIPSSNEVPPCRMCVEEIVTFELRGTRNPTPARYGDAAEDDEIVLGTGSVVLRHLRDGVEETIDMELGSGVPWSSTSDGHEAHQALLVGSGSGERADSKGSVRLHLQIQASGFGGRSTNCRLDDVFRVLKEDSFEAQRQMQEITRRAKRSRSLSPATGPLVVRGTPSKLDEIRDDERSDGSPQPTDKRAVHKPEAVDVSTPRENEGPALSLPVPASPERDRPSSPFVRQRGPDERTSLSYREERSGLSKVGLFAFGILLLAIGLAWFKVDKKTTKRTTVSGRTNATLDDAGAFVCHVAIEEEDDEDHSESWATWVFLFCVMTFGFIAARFLMREYSLFSRTYQRNHEKSFRLLFRQFIFYRLDYWFSTSGRFKPAVLFITSLVLVIVGGPLYFLAKGDTLGASMWHAWLFISDPGSVGDENELGARIVAFFLTICGMLVFALLIGIISDAISEKFDSLKQGKAMVIEADHTLVLGWSDKTLPFIREIALANESEGGGVICVLAEVNKEVMESEIRESGIALRGTTVVVRKGSPSVEHNLRHVSAEKARCIVVMSPANTPAEEADMWALRVTLCLMGMGYNNGHIVVELRDIDNLHLFELVGGKRVEAVVAHDFIGRLIIQSSRQSGIAQVLEQILGFEGSEFYLEEWPDLVGKSFGELVFLFEGGIPIGVRKPDGTTLLNPVDQYALADGDQLIVLAEDNDTYSPAPTPIMDYQPSQATCLEDQISPASPRVESILIIGWRRDLGDMFVEIDRNVCTGTMLTILCTVPLGQREAKLSEDGREGHKFLKNTRVRHNCGKAISRRDLERLPIEEYTAIIIVTDEELEADMEAADSRTLTALLLIRDIRARRLGKSEDEEPRCIISSEVLDARTRNLIPVAKITDYVMSNEVVSSALAMVAECREVNGILREILSAEGNEIYLRPVEEYMPLNEPFSFWEAAVVVRSRHQLLLGYKGPGFTTKAVLNPDNKHEKLSWGPGYRLIVVSED